MIPEELKKQIDDFIEGYNKHCERLRKSFLEDWEKKTQTFNRITEMVDLIGTCEITKDDWDIIIESLEFYNKQLGSAQEMQGKGCAACFGWIEDKLSRKYE